MVLNDHTHALFTWYFKVLQKNHIMANKMIFSLHMSKKKVVLNNYHIHLGLPWYLHEISKYFTENNGIFISKNMTLPNISRYQRSINMLVPWHFKIDYGTDWLSCSCTMEFTVFQSSLQKTMVLSCPNSMVLLWNYIMSKKNMVLLVIRCVTLVSLILYKQASDKNLRLLIQVLGSDGELFQEMFWILIFWFQTCWKMRLNIVG